MTPLQKAFAALVLVVVTALPAAATPPDAINLRDEVFGISSSHLFLLRTVDDNLGVHGATQGEVFLVAVDLRTGEETLWSVYAFRRGPELTDGAGDQTQIAIANRRNRSDPFAILAEYGGQPQSPGSWPPGAKATLDADSLQVTSPDMAPSYALESKTLLSKVTASINLLAERLEAYDRPAPFSAKDLLVDRTYPVDQCTVSDPAQLSALPEADSVQVVRLTCGDGEYSDGVASLIVVVPPVPN
jgi:hypothetical protein